MTLNDIVTSHISGDFAEKEEARHLDNIPSNRWAHFANDGDETSCSYTNIATASRTRTPWWRVQFPKAELIHEMTFLTEPEYLRMFILSLIPIILFLK